MKTGLTSVTFRNLPYQEIISLAKDNHLDGIEWGGDIHCPPGDLEKAAAIKADTIHAGLSVLSYGSYYKLGEQMDFTPVLQTAIALGAPIIRIWAGVKPSAESNEEDYLRLAAESSNICAQAKKEGITVSTEYHPDTLTDCIDSALKFLSAADGLTTYWQPNQKLTLAQNKDALERSLPYLTQIHVFHWTSGYVRHPLAEGESDWGEYIKLAGTNTNYILEFVKEDSKDQFSEDAKALKTFLGA